MAHLSEGTLRRKLDDEDALSDSDIRHYSACAECQSRYAELAEDARAVAVVLAVPELNVDVASALNRVRSAPAAQPRFGIRLPIMRPASRPIMGGLAAAALIVALVVTGVAQDALNFFHPTTVQPVTVSVADLQSLKQRTRERSEAGQLRAGLPGAGSHVALCRGGHPHNLREWRREDRSLLSLRVSLRRDRRCERSSDTLLEGEGRARFRELLCSDMVSTARDAA